MRPIQVKVGPLVAASTNNISTSQVTTANSYLVLNGTTAIGSANNICLSQSGTTATALTINGTSKSLSPYGGAVCANVGGGATGSSAYRVYITSAGNDSGITFALYGSDINGGALTETISGSNAGVAVSNNAYYAIYSIIPSGNTASTVTVGWFGPATLDTARRVLITTAATISFTITGTDWAGAPAAETVTNSGSSVQSVMSYLTVTSIQASASSSANTITVGTSGVADSPWVRLDDWAMSQTGIQCTVTGTVNYTVNQTLDSDESMTAAGRSLLTWVNSNDTNVVAQTASAQSNYAYSPRYARVTLNSGTGSVLTTFNQASAVPY